MDLLFSQRIIFVNVFKANNVHDCALWRHAGGLQSGFYIRGTT
jgi:hypothetical protein